MRGRLDRSGFVRIGCGPMNPSRPKLRGPLIGGLIIIALIAAGYGLRSHFSPNHNHAHDHGHATDHGHAPGHTATALALNEGKRWQTDEPLRLGMQRIRDAFVLRLNGGDGHALPAAPAKALADTVQENVQYLIQNCRLAPEADANLHLIINDLLAGASLLTTEGRSAEGVAKLAHALRAYPAYFEHPDWSALPEPAP